MCVCFFKIGNKAILIVQSKILQLNLAPIDLQKFSVWEEERNTEQNSELCVCRGLKCWVMQYKAHRKSSWGKWPGKGRPARLRQKTIDRRRRDGRNKAFGKKARCSKELKDKEWPKLLGLGASGESQAEGKIDALRPPQELRNRSVLGWREYKSSGAFWAQVPSLSQVVHVRKGKELSFQQLLVLH